MYGDISVPLMFNPPNILGLNSGDTDKDIRRYEIMQSPEAHTWHPGIVVQVRPRTCVHGEGLRDT